MICKHCGFVSTLTSKFVKILFYDEFGDRTIGYECRECMQITGDYRYGIQVNCNEKGHDK